MPALELLARSPILRDMGKCETELEPVELEDYSGWYVLITPHDRVEHRISSFKTEAEARAWIDENSAYWLATYAPSSWRAA